MTDQAQATEVPTNVNPGSIAAMRDGAQSKLSEQYLEQAKTFPAAEGMNPAGPHAMGAAGMDKSKELEAQGLLPNGATILYDGPVAGSGNPRETCMTTPTTESITLMPDGSRVITDSSTTVCTPNGEPGHNHMGAIGKFEPDGHGGAGFGLPSGGLKPWAEHGESAGQAGVFPGGPGGPGGPVGPQSFEGGPHGPILNKSYPFPNQAVPVEKQP